MPYAYDETYADSFSDNVSQSTDSDSEISSDSDNDILVRPSKIRLLFSSDPEEDDECHDNNEWVENDIVPELHGFYGRLGSQILPDDVNSVRETVQLFVGDDLIEMFVTETNRYFRQNCPASVNCKTVLWTDVTILEMRKFLALIIIMGYVQKDDRDDYWSADPLIATPIFSETMTRNRFRQIWTYWHFNNNETLNQNRLMKIENILTYFTQKFQNMYKPKRDLFLKETIIPWRGKLPLRKHNPAKIMKYGILVRTVSEATSGYICNLEMYCGGEKKLEKTIFPVLKPFLNLWHNIYMDNYYNSIKTTEKLLDNKTRVCGIVRKNRGVPDCLKNLQLKINESKFRRKGDILIQAWKSKQKAVCMVSSIHSAQIITTGKTNKKTNENIKVPTCVFEYNRFMKSVSKADQYLSYFSILRKSKKWTKKAVLHLLNCALFNAYTVYKYNSKQNIHYRKFLLSVARVWITNEEIISTTVCDNAEPGVSKAPTKRVSRYDPPTRLSLDMSSHRITKIVGKGKIENPRRACRVCTASKKRSSTMFMCTTCKVPLHVGKCFEKYHTLKKY